jgi:predicted transcriptional regulator of viral defense system
VTVDDAVARLDLDRREAAKLLARWTDQGWLRRVRRGLYVAVPVNAERPDRWSADPLVLATRVWAPCYFTGWTAANYWGLTEQVFQTTVVRTAARVRAAEQTLLDHEYRVGSIREANLAWGIRAVWVSGTKISMADEARVVIDVLDDPAIGGGIRHCAEVLTTYLTEHDRERLLEYADLLDNGAVLKRLGYLCERMDLTDDAFLEACEDRLTAGIALLDPSVPEQGGWSARWRVRENVVLEPGTTS